jgi:hypothetical protein
MKNFSVNGYKAFNNIKEFEFAPINLLIGKNGSGKSNLINSMLLLKEVFSKRRLDALSEIFNERDKARGIRNENQINIGNYCLNSVITTPFSTDGLFSKSTINSNSNKKYFEISFRLNLDFFKDNFIINLRYQLNLKEGELNGPAYLSEIIIKSVDKKTTLLEIKSIDDKESNIKINTKYVNLFLKQLELKYKKLHPNDDGSSAEAGNYADGYDQYKKEIGPDGTIKKLMTPFTKIESLELLGKVPSINIGNDNVSLISLYREHIEIKDNSEDTITSENTAPDSKRNKELFLKELNGNGRNVIGRVGDVFNGLTGTKLSYFSEFQLPLSSISYEDFEIPKSENTKDETVMSFEPNKELNFILHYMILKNISNAISRANEDLNEYLYIPPSRSSFYRAANTNTEITKKIKDQLIEITNRDSWSRPYINFFNNWINELKLPNFKPLKNLRELYDILSSKNELLSDSGYGINQLIPLLASISFFNENFDYSNFDAHVDNGDGISKQINASNFFLIEEPEANLHPSYQSKLADIFIDSAWKFGHQFVIETHSEYMVRKFQYWVAKGKIKPSDVNIYYFDNKNEDPEIKDLIIKKISINKDGSLSEPFGEGFFDEATNWQFELLKIKNAQNN